MEMDLFHLMDDQEGPTLHAIALFVALLCACIVVGHHLEKNRWVNDSIIALGIYPGEEKAVVPKLHHEFTIMLFGVIGSFISFGIISIALGAILSATDSVCTLRVLNQEEAPLLYSLVFGEGVVNDATSVVLFNAIRRFDAS